MIMDRTRRLIVIGVVFIAFNLLAFVIPFERGGAFWVAYFFSLLAIGGLVLADWVAFRNATTLTRAFLGMPIIKVAVGALTTQLITGFAYMIAATFLNVGAWQPAVTGTIILATAIIFIFKVDWGREVIERVDERKLASTAFMITFRADVQALLPRIADEVLKTKVAEIAQTAKRSDPVTSEAIAMLEAKIADTFRGLESAVKHNVLDDAHSLADELSHQLTERNIKCKASKQQFS
jgi:hypothetical protein